MSVHRAHLRRLHDRQEARRNLDAERWLADKDRKARGRAMGCLMLSLAFTGTVFALVNLVQGLEGLVR